MASPAASVSDASGEGARIGRWLGRLVDLDFTAPYAFATLALVYIASRIPWLDQGYGTDPDAWRVALSAQHLVAEGEYLPSRLPGFPLHELATSLIIEGGWFWTNLSTVLISLAGVYLFARLMRELALPHAGVLTLGFAFAPFLWINSVMTIDYMWALTFILGAYLALVRRSTTVAGVLLGVAAGFRLTSLAMFFPFWLLLWRSDRREEVFPLTRATVAVFVVVYTPVLVVYGLKFLNFYEESVPLETVVRQLGKDGLGVLGALAVLAALAFSFGRLRRLPADLAHDAHALAWVAAIVVFVLAYSWAPHEVAFLIPVFPFGLLLLSRYLTRGVLVAVVAVVIAAGFVDLTASEESADIRLSTLTSVRLGKGMLLTDLDTREDQTDLARDLRRFTAAEVEPGSSAIVITGSLYPEFAALFEDQLRLDILERDLDAISVVSDVSRAVDRGRSIQFVWLLDLDRFQQLQAEGNEMYYTTDAARGTFALFGYRPGYYGALPLSGAQGASPLGEGAVPLDR